MVFPGKRITVNLAPADIRKAGPSYDLPITVGVIVASEQGCPQAVERARENQRQRFAETPLRCNADMGPTELGVAGNARGVPVGRGEPGIEPSMALFRAIQQPHGL